MRIEQVNGKLKIFYGTVTAPTGKDRVFLLEVRYGKGTVGSGLKVVGGSIPGFCLHIIFVSADILGPDADNQSAKAVTVTETGTQNPVQAPTCLFQQTFIENAVFPLYGTGHFQKGNARFGGISGSLCQVGCIVPTS